MRRQVCVGQRAHGAAAGRRLRWYEVLGVGDQDGERGWRRRLGGGGGGELRAHRGRGAGLRKAALTVFVCPCARLRRDWLEQRTG